MKVKKSFKSILWSTQFAIVLGVLAAVFFPGGKEYFSWIGVIFISLLKALILPLVLFSCFKAISSSNKNATLGKTTLFYYITSSMMAAFVGLVSAYIFLGENMSVTGGGGFSNENSFDLTLFISKFIPTNIFQSMADGNILHIVFVAVVLGLISKGLSEKKFESISNVTSALDKLFLLATGKLIILAPIGVFSLVYRALASMKWNEVTQLSQLVIWYDL